MAVPYGDEAVVFGTWAMTQYSYGKMSIFGKEEKSMPHPAGF